jgi:hypothetical protein
MSDTGFRRSILNQSVASDRIEHRFLAAYEQANSAWSARYRWPLFRPLHDADAHVLQALHVPTNPSISQ